MDRSRPSTIIRARQLCHSYGQGELRRQVLQSIDLTIAAGDLNQELTVQQLAFEFAALSSIYQHSNTSLMPTSCMSASSARVRRHSR